MESPRVRRTGEGLEGGGKVGVGGSGAVGDVGVVRSVPRARGGALLLHALESAGLCTGVSKWRAWEEGAGGELAGGMKLDAELSRALRRRTLGEDARPQWAALARSLREVRRRSAGEGRSGAVAVRARAAEAHAQTALQDAAWAAASRAWLREVEEGVESGLRRAAAVWEREALLYALRGLGEARLVRRLVSAKRAQLHLQLLAAHVKAETAGSVQLHVLDPGGSQFLRCEKAVRDNLHGAVWGVGDLPGVGVRVEAVAKVEHRRLLAAFQDAASLAPPGAVKGLFTEVPSWSLAALVARGAVGSALPRAAIGRGGGVGGGGGGDGGVGEIGAHISPINAAPASPAVWQRPFSPSIPSSSEGSRRRGEAAMCQAVGCSLSTGEDPWRGTGSVVDVFGDVGIAATSSTTPTDPLRTLGRWAMDRAVRPTATQAEGPTLPPLPASAVGVDEREAAWERQTGWMLFPRRFSRQSLLERHARLVRPASSTSSTNSTSSTAGSRGGAGGGAAEMEVEDAASFGSNFDPASFDPSKSAATLEHVWRAAGVVPKSVESADAALRGPEADFEWESGMRFLVLSRVLVEDPDLLPDSASDFPAAALLATNPARTAYCPRRREYLVHDPRLVLPEFIIAVKFIRVPASPADPVALPWHLDHSTRSLQPASPLPDSVPADVAQLVTPLPLTTLAPVNLASRAPPPPAAPHPPTSASPTPPPPLPVPAADEAVSAWASLQRNAAAQRTAIAQDIFAGMHAALPALARALVDAGAAPALATRGRPNLPHAKAADQRSLPLHVLLARSAAVAADASLVGSVPDPSTTSPPPISRPARSSDPAGDPAAVERWAKALRTAQRLEDELRDVLARAQDGAAAAAPSVSAWRPLSPVQASAAGGLARRRPVPRTTSRAAAAAAASASRRRDAAAARRK